jgi:hypothetical protein
MPWHHKMVYNLVKSPWAYFHMLTYNFFKGPKYTVSKNINGKISLIVRKLLNALCFQQQFLFKQKLIYLCGCAL